MKFIQKKLGEYCKIRNGYAFKSNDFIQNGIPIVRIGDIADGKISLDKTIKVKEESTFSPYIISKGDILIAMSGATTGKLGRYTYDFKAYQNQRVGCFNPIKEKLNSEYLFFLLKSLRDKILLSANGGAQPNISAREIESLIVPIPERHEDQIRIANVLSRAEALIAKRKESIQLLDELLICEFQNRFIKTNQPIEKLESLTIKITDGEHQKPVYLDNGLPFISVVNISKGFLDFNNCKFVSNTDYNKFTKRCNPEFGDILYTKVGATYGRAAIIDSKRPFCLYVSVALLKVDHKKINSQFLRFALNHPFVKRQADKAIKGAGVPDLHLIEIKKFQIPYPDKESQTQFAQIVEKVENIKTKFQQSLQELENLYASLSQKAFKGELDLSKMEIEEQKLDMAAESEIEYLKK